MQHTGPGRTGAREKQFPKATWLEDPLKTPQFAVLIAVLVLLAAGSALAQPTPVSVNQSVNLTVPSLFRFSVTPGTVNIALAETDFPPGSNVSNIVENASTSYAYVHNNSTAARITVSLQAALPTGMNLAVRLSGGTGDVNLTTTAQEAQGGISRGAGSGTATYKFSADPSQAPVGTTNSVVVFTLTTG